MLAPGQGDGSNPGPVVLEIEGLDVHRQVGVDQLDQPGGDVLDRGRVLGELDDVQARRHVAAGPVGTQGVQALVQPVLERGVVEQLPGAGQVHHVDVGVVGELAGHHVARGAVDPLRPGQHLEGGAVGAQQVVGLHGHQTRQQGLGEEGLDLGDPSTLSGGQGQGHHVFLHAGHVGQQLGSTQGAGQQRHRVGGAFFTEDQESHSRR